MAKMLQTLVPRLAARLLQACMVALLVGVATFLMARSLPGDMAYRIAAGRYGYDMVDRDAAAKVAAELDLGQSSAAALSSWFGDLLRFDLGTSLVTGQPVVREIAHQLSHSMTLALTAILLSLFIGPPLGILAGLRPNGLLDRGLFFISTALKALPQFVIGMVLVMVFGVTLQILPAAGHDHGAHLILPALTLALGLAAMSNRVARDATVAVAGSAYYGFGRIKGLSDLRLFMRHGLRNIAVPVVTYLGLQFIYLVEGVVVVETLFAWPGIGHALVHAVFGRDVPMIQGTALVMGLMFVALNAAVDLACHLIDPRLRQGKVSGARKTP
ncbi:ABC transporter permease [Allorhizobium undicola]|uniref:ABC transporter permease n=1 Tax=Allorhizobium undicola TaxID=78527 RepID=UPI001FD96C96|nr:ABC transporter permease [Allorhizobium undicola]